MSNWDTEVSIALAQLLGIGAVVGSLLVWRAVDSVAISRRLRALTIRYRNGVLGQRASREFFSLLARAGVALIGIYFAAHFFLHLFGYLSLANWITDHRVGLDSGHIERLFETSRNRLDHALLMGTAASLFLGMEWVIQLLAVEEEAPLRPSDLIVAEVVPPAWRSSPQALWEARVAEMEASPPHSMAIDWRNDWSVWASMVVKYRAHIARGI